MLASPVAEPFVVEGLCGDSDQFPFLYEGESVRQFESFDLAEGDPGFVGVFAHCEVAGGVACCGHFVRLSGLGAIVS